MRTWGTYNDEMEDYGEYGPWEGQVEYWESMRVEPLSPKEPEVWQQRITDEMREKFKGGMSLTQREDTGLLGSYA